MSGSKKTKTLDKSSSSPIRNLFKENEEAYNKYHEKKQSDENENSEGNNHSERKAKQENLSNNKAPNNKPEAVPNYKDDDDTSDIYGEIVSEKEADSTYRNDEEEIVENDVYNEPNSNLISGTVKVKKKRFGKLKEGFNKVINALKQQPEENNYEDETDDIFSLDDIDQDLNTAKEIYKIDKTKKENNKSKDEDEKAVKLIISKNKLNFTSVDSSSIKAEETNKTQLDNKDKETAEKPEIKAEKSIEPKEAKSDDKAENPTETKEVNSEDKAENPTEAKEVNSEDKAEKTAEKPEIKVEKQTETKEAKSEDKAENSTEAKKVNSEDKAEKPVEKPEIKAEKPTEPKEAKSYDKAENSTETKEAKLDDKAENTAEIKEDKLGADDQTKLDDFVYDVSNVIYTSPGYSKKKNPESQEKSIKKETTTEHIEDVMPSANKNERRKKELPVYDIFAEYAKEQEAKNKSKQSDKKQSEKNDTTNNKEKTDIDEINSDTASFDKKSENSLTENKDKSAAESEKSNETQKTETASENNSESILPRGTDENKESSVHQEKNEDIKFSGKITAVDVDESGNKIISSDTEAIKTKEASDSSKKSVSRYRADDLPGGDGIRIIPWQIPKPEPKPEPEPKNETVNTSYDQSEPDLTEGHVSSVTYHYSHAVPFIVMAGKFSKTLRGEYEAVMMYKYKDKYNKKAPKSTVPVSSDVSEKKPEKKSKAPNITKIPVPYAVESSPAIKSQEIKSKAVKETVKKITSDPIVNSEAKKQRQPLKEIINDNDGLKPKEKTVTAKTHDYGDQESVPEKINKKSSFQKRKKPLLKEKRKKFDFRQLFDGDEEYDPDDNLVEEIKPQLDDYTEEKDAEAISTDIATTFQMVFARTIILTGTTVTSIVLSLIAQCTPLFKENIRNGWLWYAIMSFLLFAISVITYRLPIVNGLMPLRKFKGNPDTAPAVASVAVAVQSVAALFTPHIFINGTLHIYVPLVLFALLLNSIGKLLILLRTHRNFAFLRKPYPKFAGKIYNDGKNAQKMVEELPSKKTIIGFTKRAKFMSNFLQLSYMPDPSEHAASKAAPITTFISLLSCVAYGVINQSFVGAVSSFALTACISIPVICLLAINIPLKRLCTSVLRSGAMITGYETVKQFCDTNAIMVDSSQLYPKGSITLSGMKAFKQSKLNEAILAGAAIMYAVNGNMVHVFENIVQCRREALPEVENVIYEDGKGLVGWVRGQRVLIGNRELLESHNIKTPGRELEERYIKMGNDITYISVSGELIAMFILSYKTDRSIAKELRNLEQNGVSLIVRTVDSNITKEKIAERFGLFHRCISIMPTGLGNIYYEETKNIDEKSRAYLVTRGKLSSFAKAVSGCIKLKSNATITKILQYIAVILGLALVTLISFVSGFEKLGCLEMLIYIGFWTITSLFVSIIRK